LRPRRGRPELVLREHEAGAKTADLARKYGVSEGTLYNWKAEYGGMDEAARPRRHLEARNRALLCHENLATISASRDNLDETQRRMLNHR
jgi:putative transposase